MNSYVQKCLFLILVFAAGVAATPQDVLGACVYAGTITNCDDEGEAGAACAGRAGAQSNGGSCQASTSANQWLCYQDNAMICGGGSWVYKWNNACINEPDVSGVASGISPDPAPLAATSACKDGCEFSASTPANNICSYSDDNGDGVLTEGEAYSCPRDYTATGNTCNFSGSTSAGVPAYDDVDAGVPTYDCTNTDCSAPGDAGPPIDGGGAGSGDPNDSGGSAGGADGGTDGGNAGGGDGDPDTPGTGDGTGSGDIDGDGDRDVDCNPLTNPDCAYSGSGNASGICGTPPTCNGDPVQCAILMQNYNVMCAILTTAENDKKDEEAQSAQASNDCDTPPQCDGDPVQCTMIRQMWENQCNLIDTGSETPLSDDPDYGRDLAGEGEGTEVDISSGLDEAGLGTGTCPAPIAINTTWANFTIDTAPLCSIAGWVRVFVILFTLLWAGPYVVRSF